MINKMMVILKLKVSVKMMIVKVSSSNLWVKIIKKRKLRNKRISRNRNRRKMIRIALKKNLNDFMHKIDSNICINRFIISFLCHRDICTSDYLFMFLHIKRICSFNFPRIKKSMSILKYILTNLNLSSNNITIPQSNILQLNFRLQYITITKLTICYIRFYSKYIIRTYFNYITLYLAIIFY